MLLMYIKNCSLTSSFQLINVVDICENRLTLDRHVLQKRVEIWTNISGISKCVDQGGSAGHDWSR
jgi:hypothetical protein